MLLRNAASRELRFGDSFALHPVSPALFCVQFIALHGSQPAPGVLTAAGQNGETPVEGLFKFDEAFTLDEESDMYHNPSLYAKENVPSGMPGSVAAILRQKAHQVSPPINYRHSRVL